jgi:sterol desaturase/sphingolipid hydroxylase (fatty acid hydroxylase superfamily)
MSLANPMYVASFVFAGLILLEALFDGWQRTREYEAKDTLVNIVMGYVSQLWGLLWKALQAVIYINLYELSPLRVPTDAVWAWVVLFVLDDFFYYWFHRISHESRFFWNFHVVHHSSERFNLSVAVRQSWFSGLADWIFYAPLALLGFPFWMRVAAHAWNLIYQFWIHTPFVKSLGPLDYVLNTPAHHSVHHAVNERYLDKNYGGILIVWDRIFGSFVPETEKPRYGIIKPLNSFNPVWANLHAWAEMFAAMREKTGWRAKLRCLWGRPAMEF